MAETYDIGDRIRLKVEFRNIDGGLADPTAVTVKHRDPSGNVATPVATKDSTGRYYYDLDIDEAGVWYYRFAGTGAVVAAAEDSFTVRASQF